MRSLSTGNDRGDRDQALLLVYLANQLCIIVDFPGRTGILQQDAE